MITRRIKHSQSGALLQGKLFDDKGNRMGPSFSSKNGIRYRFYVSTALRGRRHQAGSVARLSAPEIEGVIEKALWHKFEEQADSREAAWDRVERVVVRPKSILLTINSTGTDNTPAETIEIPWTARKVDRSKAFTAPSAREPDQKLVQAIVRAHVWLSEFANDHFSSIEALASKAEVHPKIMRQALKLAFLAPDIVTSILAGGARFELADLRNVSALSWQRQRDELHQAGSPHRSN